MPWTKIDYPNAMKNLVVAVRNKAIEIANALLDERHLDDGIAMATAISRAKDQTVEHGLKADNHEKSRITDVKVHGQDHIVIPYEREWKIKVEGKEIVKKVFHTQKEAISQVRQEAKEVNGSLTIQLKTGRIERRLSYNPNNKGPL